MRSAHMANTFESDFFQCRLCHPEYLTVTSRRDMTASEQLEDFEVSQVGTDCHQEPVIDELGILVNEPLMISDTASERLMTGLLTRLMISKDSSVFSSSAQRFKTVGNILTIPRPGVCNFRSRTLSWHNTEGSNETEHFPLISSLTSLSCLANASRCVEVKLRSRVHTK